jgi:hypothetical protein
LQGFLFQVDISQIIVDEADEPNSLVDLLDAEPLSGQDGGEVDFLSVDADTAAGGDEDVALAAALLSPNISRDYLVARGANARTHGNRVQAI